MTPAYLTSRTWAQAVTEPEFADPSPAIGRRAEAVVPLLGRALG